jgi:hypothetical protein
LGKEEREDEMEVEVMMLIKRVRKRQIAYYMWGHAGRWA